MEGIHEALEFLGLGDLVSAVRLLILRYPFVVHGSEGCREIGFRRFEDVDYDRTYCMDFCSGKRRP